MAFQKTRSRDLLDVEFFSRAACEKLLPQAAHKWNLGALAFFIHFVSVYA